MDDKLKDDQKQEIRVRIAPSPTGYFHFGTARTALFNYLFAKKNKGKFILRIEDTDLERSEKKYEKDIIDNLKWLGLEYDEGPFRQTERLDIYEKYIKQLLKSGQAFWCEHTQEELDQEKKKQMERKQAPRHICSPLTANRSLRDKKGIIRFRCPEKKVIFNDLIKGRVEFDTGLLGDMAIAKDERTPLYNFAVVIDDAEMKISHVIRGEDHLSNTPKQILIAKALGFDIPQFAHLPLILGPDKSKMSKRHGATSINWYKKQGYLPAVLLNFMAFLGWNPGTTKEIFSLEELIKEFSLERVQKGGAIFNRQRLEWLNGYYIREMSLEKLTNLCLPYLIKDGLIEPIWGQGSRAKTYAVAPDAYGIKNFKIIATDEEATLSFLEKIIALEQKRIKKLSEIGKRTKYFFLAQLDYAPELLIWKKMTLEEVKNNLDTLYNTLSKINNFDKKTVEGLLMPLIQKHGSGELLWPLRACLSGEKASPGPFEIMEVMGKEKTLKRIKEAIGKISCHSEET